MPVGLDEMNVEDKPSGKTVLLTFKEKLRKEDYKEFVPQLEWLIAENKKINILVELRDFQGWSSGALWEETKFGAKHFNDVERLAIVGEKQWEKGIALFIKPFTSAKVRFFESGEMGEAKHWISQKTS